MLIGLVSDTHIAWPDTAWPSDPIHRALQGVDLILHAGDVWIPWVLDDLETIAPVLAAQGDDDMEADFGDDKRLVKRQVLSYEGVDLWVQHIKPRYGQINPAWDTNTYAHIMKQPKLPAETNPPSVVVFGHSHFAEIENYKGTMLINPGSPTMPQYLPKLGTIGLLRLECGKVDARLVPLE